MSAFSPSRPGRALVFAFAFALFPAVAPAQKDDIAAREPPPEMPRTRDDNPEREDRVPIFFPPIPPSLGDLSPGNSLPGNGPANAPEEMSLYLEESFYATLGTRLSERDFSSRLRHKLDRYRNERDNLLVDLHAELERTRDFSREDRLAALEALAAIQTPILLKLEQLAEDLRDSFARSGYDWSALRTRRLGVLGHTDSPGRVAPVLRATAYYQSGLSAAQRRLLREAADEVLVTVGPDAPPPPREGTMWFLPEASRVRIPAARDGALARKISEFLRRKNELKDELTALVIKEDGDSFNFQRTLAFSRLADKQAGRIGELERLAEEIRRDYAATRPVPPRAVLSPLPPVLTARIAAVIDQRRGLHRDTIAQLNELKGRHPDLPAVFRHEFRGNELRTQIIPFRVAADLESAAALEIDRFRLEVRAVLDSYDARLAEIVKEILALRVEVGAFLGTTDKETINRALGTAALYATIKATEDAYADYRVATLEPGLSPEQRRMLFGAALGQLDMALPAGELQPTGGRRR